MRRRWTCSLAAAVFLLSLLASPAVSTAAPAAIDPTVDPTIAATDDEGQEKPSRRKKDRKKRKDDDKGGKKDKKKFASAIKDHRKIDGLVTVYEKDGEFVLALRPHELGKVFMMSVTRHTGIGQSFLLASQVLGENPVRFMKVGKKIQMLLVNPYFRAEDDPEMRRAVNKSFSDSLVGASKIQ